MEICILACDIANVVVAVHPNGWMDADSVIRWLEECVKPFIRPRLGRQAKCAMIVLDSYGSHLTDEVKEKFIDLDIAPAVIPYGCTEEVQPLDVSVNKAFKASIQQQWILRAWKAVPPELIKKAFLTCGLSNALDGSEDGLHMAHRRGQMVHKVDVDDDVIAIGFFGNNCEEPDPRAALLQPAAPPFAARSPPLVARAPPCSCPPCWPALFYPHSPDAHRPAACAIRLVPALLLAALLVGALLPMPPCYCPPYCAPPCCRHAAQLPACRRAGRRTALPCLRAALLAAALPFHLHCPALAVRRSSLAVHRPALPCAPPCLRAALLVARHPALPAMASLSILTFDHEGRPIQFDSWLDDLQLYLLSDSRDSVSLFDHTSGASLAPPATPDSATCSQWLTLDAVDRLAVRNHLPFAERAHFGKHKTAIALYDVVVTRCSSPATAALGRLILPYLFPSCQPLP
ncbi:unnamed protein product [Closterium sp. NIES-53]